MNSKERIMAAIAREKTGRVPSAFWLPDSFGREDPAENAERTVQFWKTWDTDLVIPVNERGYAWKDYAPPAVTQNGGVLYTTHPDEWRHMAAVSVNHGALGRAQETLAAVLEKTGSSAVVLFRIASPLAALLQMAPQAAEDIRRGYGEAVKSALRTMTETECALVQRAVEMGADGIFLEAPLADYEDMEEPVYREYGMPYDLAVLSASAGWCNAVRAGMTNCMFPLVRKYPAQIFSWDASCLLPRPGEAQALTGRCIMAGIRRRHLEFGMKNETERDLYDILIETGGRGLILSAGAPVHPRRGMAAFFRRSLQEMEERLLCPEKG